MPARPRGSSAMLALTRCRRRFVAGYYVDHNHDDRDYTEVESDAALAAKADIGASYTKAESVTFSKA